MLILNTCNFQKKILFNLKSGRHLSKKFIVIFLTESPLKEMKNVFYFILKPLSVLKILKFLLRLFGHVGKTAWLEL